MKKISILIALITMLFVIACQQKETETYVPGDLPEWAKSATIYEVNLRQYFEDASFLAFSKELPRLKKMGVDILWFMPINPISMTKRKATPSIMIEEVTDAEERKKYLGSPYSVSDYRAVNPEFGTMDDFKKMLEAAHKIGLKVIIDWVPNHTGWDHQWIKDHPDWYTRVDGEIIKAPTLKGNPTDWYDVAELNFENKEMRQAMIADMVFWIKEVGIDGFRMDVAHDVPADFWKAASDSLYAAGNIFMLAEGQEADQINNGYFHSDYGWDFHHLLNEIAKGEKSAMQLESWLSKDRVAFKKGFHMMFTSNHDENTWAGTVFDRMGEGHLTFAVLCATFDGMPLIYSGQESANKKRLEFFEKDAIDWGNYEYASFYQSLFDLKHKNKALWNGEFGGEPQIVKTSNDNDLFAYYREKDGDKVLVILNFSDKNQHFDLMGAGYDGEYTDIFTLEKVTIKAGARVKMKARGYHVFSNK